MPKLNKEIYFERAKKRYNDSIWSIPPFKEPLMKLAVSDYMTYKSTGGKKVDTALENEVNAVTAWSS